MLRLARFFRGSANLTYTKGSAEAIPLGDATQTIAWSIATAHHWASVDQALTEIRRVLRPGGRLLVLERSSTPNAKGLHSHGWTPEQAEAFAAMCGDKGFRNVRVEPHRGRLEELAVLAIAD
jgi:ubiquinone/menaquinone biosynthesis C-methylase UbiE